MTFIFRFKHFDLRDFSSKLHEKLSKRKSEKRRKRRKEVAKKSLSGVFHQHY